MKFVAMAFLALGALLSVACTTGQPASAPTQDIDATVQAGVRGTQEARGTVAAAMQTRAATPVTDPTITPTPSQTPTSAPYPTAVPTMEIEATVEPSVNITKQARIAVTPIPNRASELLTPVLASTPISTPSPDSVCEEAMAVLFNPAQEDHADVVMVEAVPDSSFQLFCRALVQLPSGTFDGFNLFVDQSGELGGEFFSLEDWSCKFLLLKIVDLNKENLLKGNTDQEILKVYDIEELRRFENKLVCGGFARTSTGEINLEFSIEEDRDGDLFHSYVFVKALSRYSEEDEQLFDMLYKCTQEDQQFRQLLRESGYEGMLLYPSREDFILAITLALEAEPSGRKAIDSILSFCSIQ